MQNKATFKMKTKLRASALRFSRFTVQFFSIIAVLFFASACERIEDFFPKDGPDKDKHGDLKLPGVFTMSNEKDGNEVIYLRRNQDGTLTKAGEFDTGGKGTGKSIITSQHPIELTKDNKFLLVVSAGSNELTAFRVKKDGLERTDIVPSGGQKPVSVTTREDGLVVVLNQNNGSGNLAGFWLNEYGILTPIPNSERQLSNDPMATPAQVEFSPNGKVLVVTELFAGEKGKIVTFTVNHAGLLSKPMFQPPFGRTPFGFMFTDGGVLIVSEAFEASPGNPIPKAGAGTSLRVKDNGELEVISEAVPALGSATCWVQISNNNRFAFMTNTASNDITTFGIGHDGSLERLHLTQTGKGPLGMVMSINDRFLYNLNGKEGTITAFRVNKSDGSLTKFQEVSVGSKAAFGMMGR
jgi:6-phosphogluconolactonase (cycloisomerase 2 family)